MSTKLSRLIKEAIELPVHDLGYEKQVPHGELTSFITDEEWEDFKKHESAYEENDEEEKEELKEEEEEEEEDEESIDEDLSVADHEKNLPVHDLGYIDEVPDEELLALIGGEEERDEADLDLGSDQILPDPSVNEEKEEEEEEKSESEEEDEEDFEDAVNEALRLLSKKSSKKSKFIREEEDKKESEEDDEEEELHEDDMPDDGVYHKGGDEDGEEKRQVDEEEEEDQEEHDEIKEGLDAIFEGKKLTKSFKTKTATIFEAAVKSKVSKERKTIREAYRIASVAHRKIQEDKLVNKLSDYLDYAVNEWTKQNKVAIESSLKTQITEEFMSGLKSLFESKYIDVPQSKVKVLELLSKKVKKLEKQLNEQTKNNVDLHKNLKKAKKDLIIHKACQGLTDSNKERLISLTENFQFTTAKEFAEKVLTIRKSFFEKPATSGKSTNNRMIKSGIEIKESFDGNYEVDAYIDAFRKRNL